MLQTIGITLGYVLAPRADRFLRHFSCNQIKCVLCFAAFLNRFINVKDTFQALKKSNVVVLFKFEVRGYHVIGFVSIREWNASGAVVREWQ